MDYVDLSEVSPITRQQYLGELRHYLNFMEPQDADAVLQEYTARLDAAEDEAAMLAQLDTPMRVAIQLRKSYVSAPAPAEPQEEASGETAAPAGEAAAPEEAEPEPALMEEEAAARAAEDADLERAVGAAVAAILAEHGLSSSREAEDAPAAEESPAAAGTPEPEAMPEPDEAPEPLPAAMDWPEEDGTEEAPAPADEEDAAWPEEILPEPEDGELTWPEDTAPEDIALSAAEAPETEAVPRMDFPMEAEIVRAADLAAAGEPEAETAPAPEGEAETSDETVQTQELRSEDAPQDEADSGRVLPQDGEAPAQKRTGAFAGQVVLCVLGGVLLALVGCAVAFVGLFILDVGLRNQSSMVSDALLLYAVACLLFAGALPILAAAIRLPARRISRKRRELLLGEKDPEPKPWTIYWRVVIILLCLLGVGVVALAVAAMFTGCRIPRAAANVRMMVERIDWAYYQAWFAGLFQ